MYLYSFDADTSFQVTARFVIWTGGDFS